MKAIWNNVVVAESNDIAKVEGNSYFPVTSLKREFFIESATKSVCPWKGTASYLSLSVDGKINPDAAWYYVDPKPGADAVANRVAFWRGVKVVP